MARRLTKLKITEVSSVDRGAGEGVDVVLMKNEDPNMPWTAADAERHTGKADTPKKRHQWATVANAALADGKDDGAAIRIANAAIAKMADDENEDADLYWKREFSAEERERDAKSGAAESDGSYPIHNKSDLHNAMQAIGRSKNPGKTKAHIRARAKALGLESELSDAFKRDRGAVGTVVDSLAKARDAFVASVRSILGDENMSTEKKQLLLDTTSEQLVDHITDDIVKSLSGGDPVEPAKEDDMSPELKKALGLPENATAEQVTEAVVKLTSAADKTKDEQIAKLTAELEVRDANFSDEETLFYKTLREESQKEAFRKADKIGRITQMEKREPELLELAKIAAERDALAKRISRLEEEKELANWTKRATDAGLPASDGGTLMKLAKCGDMAAIDKIVNYTKSAIAAAKEGGLFKEFGATGTIGPQSALDELNAKALEYRKANPKFTIEQSFAKVYTDPANAALAKKERIESREAAR
jgi:hypothetical protein